MRAVASLAIVILTMFVLAATSNQALACSCVNVPPKTLTQIKAEKLQVLLGRVISRTKTGGEDINKGRLIYGIEIDKSINLPASGTISVSTAPNDGLCGVNMQVGRDQVLFIGGEAPDYTLSLCANINQLTSNDTPRRAWDNIVDPESGGE